MASVMWQTPSVRTLAACTPVWMPIPLSPVKLAQRGYNQAWELIKSLHRLGTEQGHDKLPSTIVLAPDGLQRREGSSEQHRLGRRQDRIQNVADVFWHNPRGAHPPMNQPVLLVDDVMTTGATLRSAARALKAAGIPEVRAVVFARTPFPHHS